MAGAVVAVALAEGVFCSPVGGIAVSVGWMAVGCDRGVGDVVVPVSPALVDVGGGEVVTSVGCSGTAPAIAVKVLATGMGVAVRAAG